jgi:hypothetical protein
MRILRRGVLAAILVVALGTSRLDAGEVEKKEPSEPRKDAAEAVGEGNAARWLDYYRRERGENWKQPAGEEAQKPRPAEEKSALPSAETRH